MTDSGLSTRLRQQSRRAGLMVGVTMLLAIAICIFGAAGLYAALSRPFTDLVPLVAPAAPATSGNSDNAAAAETPAADPAIATEPAETQSQPAPTTAPAETSADEGFEPTHQIAAGQSVNFRAGPSTQDQIIVALSPATPLQYLNEEQPTSNPTDGDRWMKFRTESGEEGWVREIDTEPYQP